MRILFFTVVFLLCFSSYAQLRIGVQAGVNSTKWKSTSVYPSASLGESYSTSKVFNLHGGIIGQLKVTGAWHLRSGVFLTDKGTTLDYQSHSDTSTMDVWLRYVELPVVLIYQVMLGRKTEGFAGAGFYGAYGLYGGTMGEGRRRGQTYRMGREVEFSRNNETQVYPPVVTPFDYGGMFLAGIERRRVQLLLSYSQGLKTLLNHKLFYGSYKNQVLSLSAAYQVNTKRKSRNVR
jgi:hypothetical protein